MVVSSIPSGGNFIFTDFETPRCQFCTKMSDLCYLGKTRLALSRWCVCQLEFNIVLTNVSWTINMKRELEVVMEKHKIKYPVSKTFIKILKALSVLE